MDHLNASVEALLLDQSFLNYINRSDSADVIFWENWILQHPDKYDLIAEAAAFHYHLQYQLRQPDFKQDVERFKGVFRAHTVAPSYRNLYYYAGVAATLILIAFLWFFSPKAFDDSLPRKQAYYSNPVSDKRQLTLSDGSRVTLNPNSKISVSGSYNDQDRIVYLEGQAFFEVRKDETRPFVVRSGAIATTALGTSFMVRYYGHEESIKVSLVTGKVKVEKTSVRGSVRPSVVLIPGQEVRINKKALPESFSRRNFKTSEISEWRNNRLVFHDASFADLIKKVEEWYGVKIRLSNAPVVQKHYTGEFEGKRLPEVLEALSFSHNFQYNIKGDSVTVIF